MQVKINQLLDSLKKLAILIRHVKNLPKRKKYGKHSVDGGGQHQKTWSSSAAKWNDHKPERIRNGYKVLTSGKNIEENVMARLWGNIEQRIDSDKQIRCTYERCLCPDKKGNYLL